MQIQINLCASNESSISILSNISVKATKIAIQQAVNQAVAIAVTNALARDRLNNPEATTAMSNTG